MNDKKIVCQEIDFMSFFGAVNDMFTASRHGDNTARVRVADYATKTYYSDGTTSDDDQKNGGDK